MGLAPSEERDCWRCLGETAAEPNVGHSVHGSSGPWSTAGALHNSAVGD